MELYINFSVYTQLTKIRIDANVLVINLKNSFTANNASCHDFFSPQPKLSLHCIKITVIESYLNTIREKYPEA